MEKCMGTAELQLQQKLQEGADEVANSHSVKQGEPITARNGRLFMMSEAMGSRACGFGS